MISFSKPRILDPHRWNGMRIGLLGGSFNPPHPGHEHISLAALKGLDLDMVWWLVTPQNPHKTLQPASIKTRLEQCEALVQSSKILVSDIESDLGTHITFDTIKALRKYHPRTKFVWISGMDNALSLHKWNHWKELLELIPTVHITRKPATSLIRQCPLRMYSRQHHVFIDQAARYPLKPGTTYWMLQKKMVHISSTELRGKNDLESMA